MLITRRLTGVTRHDISCGLKGMRKPVHVYADDRPGGPCLVGASPGIWLAPFHLMVRASLETVTESSGSFDP